MRRALASTIHATVRLPRPTQVLPASDSELRPNVYLGEQLLLALYWAVTGQEAESDYKEGVDIPREVCGHREAGFRVPQPCQATRRPSGGAHALPIGFPSLAKNLL